MKYTGEPRISSSLFLPGVFKIYFGLLPNALQQTEHLNYAFYLPSFMS